MVVACFDMIVTFCYMIVTFCYMVVHVVTADYKLQLLFDASNVALSRHFFGVVPLLPVLLLSYYLPTRAVSIEAQSCLHTALIIKSVLQC